MRHDSYGTDSRISFIRMKTRRHRGELLTLVRSLRAERLERVSGGGGGEGGDLAAAAGRLVFSSDEVEELIYSKMGRQEIPPTPHTHILRLFSFKVILRAQRRNYWTTVLVEVSGHNLESSQTQVFVWLSSLVFLFYTMLFMHRLQFSCFADFFV